MSQNMEANTAHEISPEDLALPAGTVLLGDQFTITGHLGLGGFGITYRAADNVLGREIVIKECFPEDFCMRTGQDVVARTKAHGEPVRSIVRMFMREARSLAQLRHPNIVGVHRAFEENNTAYMALDLIDGPDLLTVLETKSMQLTPARVRDMVMDLLDAIEKVHEIDLLHRDISPDNIIIEKTGAAVLIDFGAARADASRRTRAVTSLLMVKDGYSPNEFYVAGMEQTPSSDLYALAATFYHVISGEAPTNSQARMIALASNNEDPCKPLTGRIEGYEAGFLEAIDRAMQLHPRDRMQSAAEWRAMIEGAKWMPQPASNVDEVPIDLDVSLTQFVKETNDEVRKTRLLAVEPKTVEPEPEPEVVEVPDWVAEFNEESLSLTEAPVVEEDLEQEVEPEPEPEIVPEPADEAWVEIEEKPDVMILARADRTRTRVIGMDDLPAGVDSNWITRATEREERERAGREKEREAMEALRQGQKRPKTSPLPARSRPILDLPTEPVPMSEMVVPLVKCLSVGVVLGLIIFVGASLIFPEMFQAS